MNKNAIGLHKFSRIFRRGILQYFPHIPCRLQHALPITRKTCYSLCLHTLRADCNPPNRNKTSKPLLCLHTLRADCNDFSVADFSIVDELCLHTLRADCNNDASSPCVTFQTFASTRSVQIATAADSVRQASQGFASTRSVQIATAPSRPPCAAGRALPPHAPCRLQQQKCTECNMHFLERVLSR